jgi:hypothetical protein
MLYSYRRINLLERSVIEHGKILQSFILNYNIQMQSMNSLYNKNKLEKEEIKKINLGDKIYVSEDECSENEYIVDDIANIKRNSPVERVEEDDTEEDEDDTDTDNDRDDDEDNDEDDDEDDDDDADDDDEDDATDDEDDDEDADEADEAANINKISIQEDNLAKLLNISKKELEKNIKDLGDFEEIDLNKPYFSNNDDETFIKNLPVNLDTFNIDLNTNSKIINLNNIEVATTETLDSVDIIDNGVTKKNYSKMKVDDLKTIAVTRNLIDNEAAQKMKKADLIKIIQNA